VQQPLPLPLSCCSVDGSVGCVAAALGGLGVDSLESPVTCPE
jgi:hypothetical protein